MGGLLWLSAPFVLASGGNASGFANLLLVAALISGGMAAYGLFLALIGVLRWRDAVNAIRQTGA
jgi:putative peptidoglycan lipid II flippase